MVSIGALSGRKGCCFSQVTKECQEGISRNDAGDKRCGVSSVLGPGLGTVHYSKHNLLDVESKSGSNGELMVGPGARGALAARGNWPLSRVGTFGHAEAAEYPTGGSRPPTELNEGKRDAQSNEGLEGSDCRLDRGCCRVELGWWGW